jgi:pimeloyl-ACP methyl ester carboxylesterase
VPGLALSLGYAFAATTYRKNGLAILEGVEDVQDLIAAFSAVHTAPAKTYVVGVSEGGLVAALLAERAPDVLTSALAMCGPIGSFQGQIDYLGDFRVLFDYYFPGVLPGTAVDVPPSIMANWETVYVPAILGALAAHPVRALELLRVAHAPFDPADPTTVGQTAVRVLWYSAFATTDAQTTLGGNPYDNRFRWYFGSSNDLLLNLHVGRFAASPTAVAAVRNYETKGNLTVPMVTLHTTGDPEIPFWHEPLYFLKLNAFGRTEFTPLPVFRYGHCQFTTSEILGAFSLAAR